jgi:hypothetical protein
VKGCLLRDRDFDAAEPLAPVDVPVVPGSAAETQLQFYARRAWEESRLAMKAASPKAAAAHSYLASAYSAEVAKELAKTAELGELLLQLD